MATKFALQKTALAWCTPKTENIEKNVELAEAFAEIVDEVSSQPYLGNATTRELLEELKVRIEIHGNLDYKTTK